VAAPFDGRRSRALCLLSVPLAYALDALSFSQLYAVAFVNGVLTVLFDVAANAYLPRLISRHELVDGNSKLELSRSGAQIVGPGLAGLLIELASAPFALVADAFTFLASGALLASIRHKSPAPIVTGSRRRVADLPREIVEGTRFVVRHPHLRAIALTTTTANFFRSGLLAVLLVYLVPRLAHRQGRSESPSRSATSASWSRHSWRRRQRGATASEERCEWPSPSSVPRLCSSPLLRLVSPFPPPRA